MPPSKLLLGFTVPAVLGVAAAAVYGMDSAPRAPAAEPAARPPRHRSDAIARSDDVPRPGDTITAPDPSAMIAAADERARRRIARFADALTAEAVDPGWRTKAEGRIRASVAEVAVDGMTLEEVECRSTLCRVRFRFATVQAREANTRVVSLLVPWDSTGIVYRDERDPLRLIVYAARRDDLSPTRRSSLP